jgi:hypothetical protein
MHGLGEGSGFTREAEAFICPHRLFSRLEILHRRCPIPATGACTGGGSFGCRPDVEAGP